MDPVSERPRQMRYALAVPSIRVIVKGADPYQGLTLNKEVPCVLHSSETVFSDKHRTRLRTRRPSQASTVVYIRRVNSGLPSILLIITKTLHSLASLPFSLSLPVFSRPTSLPNTPSFNSLVQNQPHSDTMKLSITAAVVAFAASVAALPPAIGNGNANGNLANNNGKGNSQVRFPVPDDITVKQASEKCGDQAELSCCNKATYAGDTTNVDEGILAGALSNLIGAGSGSEGLGLFDQCSKLPLQGMSLSSLGIVPHTDPSSQHHRHCSQRPGQPAVQAEHCLLPELPQRCRKSLISALQLSN